MRGRLRVPAAGAVIVLLALTLLLQSPVTYAQEAGAKPTLELLQAGWDGTTVPNAWSPVRVRVTGAGGTGRVEVILQNRHQSGPQATPVLYPVAAYGQELALPAGVPKDVTIWVPASGSVPAVVRLLVDGAVQAETTMELRTARTPFWPLIGVLAESPAVAQSLGQVELPFQGLPVPLSVARLTAADLPVEPEYLRALSGLVVQGNSTATLTPQQRRAVSAWVAAGGHLLLLGGPDAARAVAILPPDTLNLQLAGSTATADLSALGRWADGKDAGPLSGPAAVLRPAGGEVLAGTPAQPLVWRTGLGEGSVTLLAADTSLHPLSTWSGTPTLFQKLLAPALPKSGENEKMYYMRQERQNIAMRLQNAVEAMPEDAFPGWPTVATVLGGFTLAAGPIMHLLLRRRGRGEWVWLAVPVLAATVSAALYYVGVVRGGRDVVANVMAHVKLDPASGQARTALAAGFYAPTHRNLTVTVPGATPVQVVNRWGGPMRGPDGTPLVANTKPPFAVMVGRDTRVEFAVGEWSMRTVVVELPPSLATGAVTARLSLEAGLIRGAITNDTPYLLEDAAVAVGEAFAKLGSLAPGQSAQVVLEPAPTRNPFQGGHSLAQMLFGRPLQQGPTAGMTVRAVSTMPAMPPGMPYRTYPAGQEPLEMPRDSESQRRIRLLESVVNVPRAGPGRPMLPLTFLAFTRQPVGDAQPQAGVHPTYFLSLIEQPLQLHLAPGAFTIPVGLMPVDIIDQSARGMGSGSDGTRHWLELHGGEMTFGYQPPITANATVESITVTTQQFGAATSMSGGKSAPVSPAMQPGPAEPGTFSVYNWRNATWEPVPAGQDAVRLQPGAAYLGPGHQIRVKVTAGEDRQVRFVQPDVTVTGVAR